jgi:hypothetical protein
MGCPWPPGGSSSPPPPHGGGGADAVAGDQRAGHGSADPVISPGSSQAPPPGRALVHSSRAEEALARLTVTAARARLERPVVAGDSAQAQAVKVVARAHQALVWERTRHVLRLRSALREFFPAALGALEDLTAPDFCLCGPRSATRSDSAVRTRCWRSAPHDWQIQAQAAASGQFRAIYRSPGESNASPSGLDKNPLVKQLTVIAMPQRPGIGPGNVVDMVSGHRNVPVRP